MFANLRLTLASYVTYKSGRGFFSFITHRITGLGTLIFLTIHITTTSLVYFAPLSYERFMRVFHTPLFTFGEVILVFCVIFHGVNGLRIVFIDVFKPKLWKEQIARNSFLITFIVAIMVWLPLAVIMLNRFMRFYLYLLGNK